MSKLIPKISIGKNSYFWNALNRCRQDLRNQMVTIWKLWMTEDKPQHLFKKRLHQRCLIMSQYASAFLSLFSFQKQPPQVFYKKMFLKNLQYSQEITCIGISFLRNFLIKHLFWRTSSNDRFCLSRADKQCLLSLHCVKSVQIRWSVFSRIRTEYWEILTRKIRTRKNPCGWSNYLITNNAWIQII